MTNPVSGGVGPVVPPRIVECPTCFLRRRNANDLSHQCERFIGTVARTCYCGVNTDCETTGPLTGLPAGMFQ